MLFYIVGSIDFWFYSVASRRISVKWDKSLPRWVGYIRVGIMVLVHVFVMEIAKLY